MSLSSKQDLLSDIENGIYCLSGSEVDVDTEEVVGAEAVVRYHHKRSGYYESGKISDTSGRDQAVSLSGSVCV